MPVVIVRVAGDLRAGVAHHVHLGAEFEHLAILVLTAIEHGRIVLAHERLETVADAGPIALEQLVQPFLHPRTRPPSCG